MTQFCQNASGKDARLYVNVGTIPTPIWVEIPEAQDLNLPMTAEELEDPSRFSRFKQYDAGEVQVEMSFAITYRPGNVNAKRFRDSFFDACAWEYAMVSGDIAVSGNEGLRMGAKTFTNTHNWPVNGQSTVDITLKHSYFEDAGSPGVGISPSWFEVAGDDGPLDLPF